MTSLCIAGCGDIGIRVAKLALSAGYDQVCGLVRSPDKQETLRAVGILPKLFDLDQPDMLRDLPTANAALLYLAPPPGGGFSDPRARNFCAAMPPERRPAKIVYVSTTAVYAPVAAGEWVTEETPAEPTTSRGRRRLDAEETFRAWGRENGVPVVILRIAGIYGPGRLPLMQLSAGHPVLIPAEARPTNRIHSDDCAVVCLAAIERGEDGGIYNVCDGNPGTITEYFTAAAELLGYPPPRQITLAEADQVMTPLMLTYVREGHLVSNHKLCTQLKVTLSYPTLAAGLPGCRPSGWIAPPTP